MDETIPYVGLVAPAGDSTIEDDLHRLCPNVHICTSRMLLEGVNAEAEVKMVEEELPRAAALLAELPLDVMVFGCTSASVAGGDAADEQIKATLRAITGARPVTVFESVCGRLREVGAGNVLVITPYPEALTAEVVDALERKGIHVGGSASMGYQQDPEIGRVTPRQIVETVTANWSPAYDALFLSCTNLRAAEVAPDLERDLGVPVVTSNRAVAERVRQMLVPQSV